MSKIEIQTDEQALELLRQLLDNPEAETPEVEFIGWPKFELHVKGDRYHSTITPELMAAFLEFQQGINKSYALLKYTDSSRRLREQERDELKILVEVGTGSSGFVTVLSEQVSKMGTALADGVKDMDSAHKLIAILGIGLMVVGGYSVSAYLSGKKEVRLTEINALDKDAERRERLATLELMQTADARHSAEIVGMFDKVVDQLPQLITASGHIAGAYDKILASTQDAESIEIQGQEVTGPIIQELSNSPRNRSVDDKVSGVYRIQGVDHSGSDEYRFKLRDVNRDLEVTATLPKDDSWVTDDILQVLQAAEWNRQVIALHLDIKKKDGRIVKAGIEKIAAVADQGKYAEHVTSVD